VTRDQLTKAGTVLAASARFMASQSTAGSLATSWRRRPRLKGGPERFDRDAYKRRNLIGRMFRRLKDWRRIAARYDKLARNHASAVALAAVAIQRAD
jgi:transposase